MLLRNNLILRKMETSKFSSFSVAMRLFQAQCILGVIGNSVPFDSKFDEFRKSVFEAMMSLSKCSEVIDTLYYES